MATGSVAACGAGQDRKTVGTDQRMRAPVAMVVTPPAALARCRRARLLRPICPRRVPASRPGRYILADGCGNEAGITIARRRCTLPAWSYQVVTPISGSEPSSRIIAWDGQRWIIPTYAALTPPTYQVHVLIQAQPVSTSVAESPTERPRRLSDVLLASARRRVADLGPVRWFGQSGRLLLEPTGASGGEEAGHVVFEFRRHQIDYEISLHAWASRDRNRAIGDVRSPMGSLATRYPTPSQPCRPLSAPQSDTANSRRRRALNVRLWIRWGRSPAPREDVDRPAFEQRRDRDAAGQIP